MVGALARTIGTSSARFWLADPARMNTHIPLRRFSIASASWCTRGRTRPRRPGRRRAPAAQAGACPSTGAAGGGDPGQHLRVAGDHAGEVHDLGDADRPVVADQRPHVGGVELARRRTRTATPARSSTRDTPKVKGSAGAASHERQPRRGRRRRWRSRGVRGARGRAVGQHRADELVDPELGGLEVHVGIDEAGRERGTGDVDLLERVALAPAGDDPSAIARAVSTHSRVAGRRPGRR